MLKTNRGIIKTVIFTILTLGIYGLFMIHQMATDARTVSGKHVGRLIFYIIFTPLTLGIYPLYWNIRVIGLFADNVRSAGKTPRLTGVSYLLWNIFGILLFGLGPLIAYVKQIHLWNDSNAVYNSKHGG